MKLSKLFRRRRPEVRESYTDQVVARLVSSASGGSDGSALAVSEACARWWSSALASASVAPDVPALRSLTPSTLAYVGRELFRVGESCHMITVADGRVELVPVSSFHVTGSYRASSWVYTCTISGPSETVTRTLRAEEVVHCRYGASKDQPWRGRSPLALAASTSRVAAALEQALNSELGFQLSQMIAPKARSEFGLESSISPENLSKIVESFSKHVQSSSFILPSDVSVSRLGPSPPDALGELRDKLSDSVLYAAGIPPSLLSSDAPGTASREAYRQLLHGTIRPLGMLVAEELKAKLDPSCELTFDNLKAGDVASTARAFRGLVDAGLSTEQAASIVGIEVSA